MEFTNIAIVNVAYNTTLKCYTINKFNDVITQQMELLLFLSILTELYSLFYRYCLHMD